MPCRAACLTAFALLLAGCGGSGSQPAARPKCNVSASTTNDRSSRAS